MYFRRGAKESFLQAVFKRLEDCRTNLLPPTHGSEFC